MVARIARVTRTDGVVIFWNASLAGILNKDKHYKVRIVERDFITDEVITYPFYFTFND